MYKMTAVLDNRSPPLLSVPSLPSLPCFFLLSLVCDNHCALFEGQLLMMLNLGQLLNSRKRDN